jgi:hypothetical protein
MAANFDPKRYANELLGLGIGILGGRSQYPFQRSGAACRKRPLLRGHMDFLAWTFWCYLHLDAGHYSLCTRSMLSKFY